MTDQDAAPARTRNAAATRACILESARRRFTAEGYDGASLRDIAAEAGVDVALVSRYFGGKEELFREVLTSNGPPDDLLSGGREDFGPRVARVLVLEPRNDAKLDKLLMVLRSTAAPKAAEVIRSNNLETFYHPLEAIIGGEDSDIRARLVTAVITGFAIMRAIDENYLLEAEARPELCERLAELLRGIVECPSYGSKP